MIAIDVGNTHMVLGLFEDAEPAGAAPGDGSSGTRLGPCGSWRLRTLAERTSCEYELLFGTLLDRHGVRPESRHPLVVSSVVPAVSAALRRLPPDWEVRIVDASWPFAFAIDVPQPGSVGADRLVNAEAALRLVGAPAVILDLGTATTLCALGEGGRYLGGAIAPGLELGAEALFRRAAKLSALELGAPPAAIGSRTELALQSGLVLGHAALLDGLATRFREELGAPEAPIVGTGGLIGLVAPHMRLPVRVEPDLTLLGLHMLWLRHREASLTAQAAGA